MRNELKINAVEASLQETSEICFLREEDQDLSSKDRETDNQKHPVPYTPDTYSAKKIETTVTKPFYLPKGFDFQVLIDRGIIKEKDKWRVAYPIHKIIERNLTYGVVEIEDLEDPDAENLRFKGKRFNTKVLKKIIGYKQKAIREALIPEYLSFQWGKPSRYEGGKCVEKGISRKYFLRSEWWAAGIEVIDLPVPVKVIKKEQESRLSYLSKPQKKMAAKIYEEFKKIAFPEARSFILSLPESENREVLIKHYLRVIDSFEQGDYHCSFDEKSGRVYSSITNLPKILRPHTRYDTQPMVNVDISGSQCLLLCCLYDEILDQKGVLKERAKFLKWTESGKIYEYFLEAQLKREGEGGRFFDRATIKDLFLPFLFVDRNVKESGVITQTMEEEFPLLLQQIRFYRNKSNKEFAQFLQTKEANAIVKVVQKCHELGIPAFSIHDSIVTTRGNEGFVYYMIKSEFLKQHQLDPHLKIDWFDQNTDELHEIHRQNLEFKKKKKFRRTRRLNLNN